MDDEFHTTMYDNDSEKQYIWDHFQSNFLQLKQWNIDSQLKSDQIYGPSCTKWQIASPRDYIENAIFQQCGCSHRYHCSSWCGWAYIPAMFRCWGGWRPGNPSQVESPSLPSLCGACWPSGLSESIPFQLNQLRILTETQIHSLKNGFFNWILIYFLNRFRVTGIELNWTDALYLPSEAL